MNVFQIKNSCFSSNTYILYSKDTDLVWLIDCGDYDKIKDFCTTYSKKLAGVFITHSHFDHIYGINDVLIDYPHIPIYLSANKGIEIISDEKKNGSRYAEMPFTIKNCHFVELVNQDRVYLSNDSYIEVLECPGHSLDSLSYIVNPYIFTGDAFIPNLRTVTKLKGGNREDAKNTVLYIFQHFSENILVAPGHNDICKLSDACIEKMFN